MKHHSPSPTDMTATTPSPRLPTPDTPSRIPPAALVCHESLCSGQIAQTEATPSKTTPGDAPVLRGRRPVRRVVTRVVILVFLVILTAFFLAARPLEAWLIGQHTATSWPLWWSPLTSPPEVSPVRLSLTLPDDRRPKAHEDFTLTLGLGTVLSTPADARLTIYAPGFDITDKNGTTVSDTYTRTITDFGHERYGMVSTQNRLERVWEIERLYLCGYEEDLTLRWRGDAPTTDSPCISASLQVLSPADTAHYGYGTTDVYYTAKGDRLHLTTKRPGNGCAASNATLSEVTPDHIEPTTTP